MATRKGKKTRKAAASNEKRQSPRSSPALPAEDFAADREVDFAAVFLAVVFLAAAFLVPAFLAVLVELRRALLFLAVFLVLVAPVSPVNSIVSGFLVSVGIAASFKGLRVQPSRLQGNVVIPTGFRLSKSLDSRTATFSVDILLGKSLCSCRSKTQYRVQDEAVRDSSSVPPTSLSMIERNRGDLKSFDFIRFNMSKNVDYKHNLLLISFDFRGEVYKINRVWTNNSCN